MRLLPDRIVVVTFISASHCEKIPSSWFSPKSRKVRVFCVEIQFGISPEIPQEFIDNPTSIHFGTIFAFLFQVRSFPLRVISFRPLILNSTDGISPVSKLFSKSSVSNSCQFLYG